LSVAREPAPNVMQIAPRVPLGPDANPERLASALEAVGAVDAQLTTARAAGSLKGAAVLSVPRFISEGGTSHIELVPMPDEVEATVRVRLEQAQQLGGAAVRQAAALLVDAGRLSFAYGRLDEAKRILTPVLQARCGADAAGYQAWESLVTIANLTGERPDA